MPLPVTYIDSREVMVILRPTVTLNKKTQYILGSSQCNSSYIKGSWDFFLVEKAEIDFRVTLKIIFFCHRPNLASDLRQGILRMLIF